MEYLQNARKKVALNSVSKSKASFFRSKPLFVFCLFSPRQSLYLNLEVQVPLSSLYAGIYSLLTFYERRYYNVLNKREPMARVYLAAGKCSIKNSALLYQSEGRYFLCILITRVTIAQSINYKLDQIRVCNHWHQLPSISVRQPT